ncbi:MAG TPA: ATP-binding protein [Elusimicrobiota bacterium]|jgi:signal transduction histidine kinase|nr:ATP-binding protein [Elusimicrobiota bacterium]
MSPAERIAVLLIEDDPDDVRSFAGLLSRPGWDGDRPALISAETLEDGLARLAEGGIQLVVLDLVLPTAGGLEALRSLRERHPAVPVVVLTGINDELLGVEAMRLGAQDYLVKGAVDQAALRRAIHHALERHRLLSKAEGVIQFVGALSHEMRTPLTIIKAAVANLREGFAGPLSPEQAAMVDMQHRNVNRLQRIVENILDLSRLESGKAEIRPRRLDAAARIREAADDFRLLARERGIAVKVALPERLPFMRADPELFGQVMTNVLDNALRFARSEVEVSARADAGEIEVLVSDDGPGIPKAHIRDIFDKFVQVGRASRTGSYKGTGLGLPICKAMVEGQNGRIWAECPDGKGAVFRIRLPQHKSQGGVPCPNQTREVPG